MLSDLVSKHGPKKWTKIAKLMTDTLQYKEAYKAKQCRERWNNYLDPNLNKGPWTRSEEITLFEQIAKFGTKFS
jgi:hypothetical protein